jgi:hypothetical protein
MDKPKMDNLDYDKPRQGGGSKLAPSGAVAGYQPEELLRWSETARLERRYEQMGQVTVKPSEVVVSTDAGQVITIRRFWLVYTDGTKHVWWSSHPKGEYAQGYWNFDTKQECIQWAEANKDNKVWI